VVEALKRRRNFERHLDTLVGSSGHPLIFLVSIIMGFLKDHGMVMLQGINKEDNKSVTLPVEGSPF
jgi:hypothetical protein